jgi:saccharopine dehydrogenase-like NADP-dependent oxidoreductase
MTSFGVIGAYGRVGLECVQSLVETTDNLVVVGGRDRQKLEAHFKNMGERISMQPVDVDDREALDRFCAGCDIVINCAGPSGRILDKVACAAIGNNSHYVDPSGNAKLYSALDQKKAEIERKALTLLIYAGLNPGVSGLLPASVAMREFDVADRIDIFHAGGGEMTFNSAYDVIESITDGSTESMVHFENGKKKKGLAPLNNYRLPDPVGMVNAYPVFSQELMAVIDRCNLKSARCYSAFMGMATPRTLFEIGVTKQYETEEQKARSARLLVNALKEDIGEKKPCFMIHVKARGKRNRADREVLATLSAKNGYKALGVVVAIAARFIDEGKCVGPGCFLLTDGVNPEQFMASIAQQQAFRVHTAEAS